MKKTTFFVLLFFFSLNFYGQIRTSKLTGIQIDSAYQETILKILQEFKMETRKRGIFIAHHISSDLGAIRVVSKEEITILDFRRKAKYPPIGITYRLISEDILGYWYMTPIIAIREDFMEDFKMARIILLHELAHFYGVGHIDNNLMTTKTLHIMFPTLNKDYCNNEIPYNSMEKYYDLLKKKDSRYWMKKNSNNK